MYKTKQMSYNTKENLDGAVQMLVG